MFNIVVMQANIYQVALHMKNNWGWWEYKSLTEY